MYQINAGQYFNTTYMLNAADEAFWFIPKRFPNPFEIINNVPYIAATNTFLGRVKLMFGDNPTVGAIIFDNIKLPTIFFQALQKNKMGYTDTAYDMPVLYAATIKVVCKDIIVGGYGAYSTFYSPKGFDKETLQSVSTVSNYICEFPNRFLNIASREKQLIEKNSPSEKKIEFWDFVANNTKTSWYFEGLLEGFARAYVGHQAGEKLKKLGYAEYFREKSNDLNNNIIKDWFGATKNLFDPKDDIYLKTYKTFQALDFNIKNSISPVIISSVDIVAKMVPEIINAYVLITVVRSAQDLMGLVTRASIYVCQNYLHPEDNNPAFEQIKNSTIAEFYPKNDDLYAVNVDATEEMQADDAFYRNITKSEEF